MRDQPWNPARKRRLAAEISNLSRDVEAFVAAAAGQSVEAADLRREQLHARIAAIRARVAAMEQAAAGRMHAAARRADAALHGNAWPAVATAIVVGILAGWLAGRR